MAEMDRHLKEHALSSLSAMRDENLRYINQFESKELVIRDGNQCINDQVITRLKGQNQELEDLIERIVGELHA